MDHFSAKVVIEKEGEEENKMEPSHDVLEEAPRVDHVNKYDQEKSKKNNLIMECEKVGSLVRETQMHGPLMSKQERLLREKALKKPMIFESVDHEVDQKGFKGEKLMNTSIKAQRKIQKNGRRRKRFDRYSGRGEERFAWKNIPGFGHGTTGTKGRGCGAICKFWFSKL